MVHYIKEVRRTSEGLEVDEFDYDRRDEKVIASSIFSFDMLDHYSYAMLNRISDEWVLRVYPIPNMEKKPDLAARRFQEIFASIKEFGASIAYVTKDNSFTVISFRDDGVPRVWDPNKTGESPDLAMFEIAMGAKIMKRLSPLGSPTYLNGEFTVVFVDDDKYHAPQEGILFVKVIDVPEEEEFKWDGEFYCRPHVKQTLVTKMHQRLHEEDKEKAGELKKRMRKQFVFNTRFVTNKGTIKGDMVEVARNDCLNVDVLTARCNLKEELSHRKRNVGFMQAFPVYAGGNPKGVVTNRQTVSSFHDWLFAVRSPVFGPSLGLVKDALIKQVNNLIHKFRAGELMYHIDSLSREENDPIRNNFVKVEKWVAAGRSLNESLFLSMTVASQVIQMLGCTGDDDGKRRFPVPFAERVSIRSEHTVEMRHHGESPYLDWNEAYIDPALGLIVSDMMFEIIAETLGGADKDDHVEVHFRTVVDEDEFFGLEPGDTAMVIIRNPVGVASDGQEVGSEYWVLKATPWQDDEAYEKYGEFPELEMKERPLCTAEMEFPDPVYTLQAQSMPNEYSKEFLIDQVMGSAKAQGVYGIHANIRMASALYDIPLPFVAPEETFIDECAQNRNPRGLETIRRVNEKELALLEENLEAADPWVLARLGLDDEESDILVEPGIFSELVDFHRAEQKRFGKEARKHLAHIRMTMKERYEEHAGKKPKLMNIVEVAEQRYREAKNLEGMRLSHRDFERIGNYVVRRMSELERDPDQPLTESRTLELYREAYAWTWSQVKPSTYPNPAMHQVYRDTDQKLMMGAMLDKLIESLS